MYTYYAWVLYILRACGSEQGPPRVCVHNIRVAY